MCCNKDALELVELFNVGEVEVKDNKYFLRRYPKHLGRFLSADGADMSKQSSGCEIRFVKLEDGKIRINLYSENEDSYVYVYRGDRLEAGHSINKNCSVIINDNLCNKIKNIDFFNNDIFSKDVVRLVIQGGYVAVDSIETYGRTIRPPRLEELPDRTMLAYGSSITHGARSGNTQLIYTHIAGQILKAQVLNKGLAGSCFCEKEIVDYFASNVKYDFMVFEHATNIYGFCMEKGYTIEETTRFIKTRGEYMVNKMLEKNPDKPIFLITPLRPETAYERPEHYKAIVEAVYDIKKSVNNNNCVLIKAEEIQTSTAFVTTDLIHPSPEGHVFMGVNLANCIKAYFPQ